MLKLDVGSLLSGTVSSFGCDMTVHGSYELLQDSGYLGHIQKGGDVRPSNAAFNFKI